MPTVVITGAGGFVGRQVALAAADRGVTVRLTSHRRPVRPGPPGTRTVPVDLADPATLRGLCDGADAVLHCASLIGGDEERCAAVNARGTAALVAEARRAGVARFVQLSTAAVYGRGTFRRARPEDLPRAPLSATSRSRAEGEDAVLDGGGLVVRPHLVHGPGDTRVVPALAGLLRALPATVDGWRASVSVIAVEDLARALVALALAPADRLTSSVYHACHPEPVRWERFLRAVAEVSGTDWPERDMSAAQAQVLLREDGRARHDLAMVTTDHWFDGTPLWADLGLSPGPGFTARFAAHAHAYRRALGAPVPVGAGSVPV
ncbi:NAD-dependent epimerase/dehydratase family protein [Streptomyces sp. JNUCC 64]